MSHHGCPERLSNRSKGFQEDGASQPTMEVLVETLTGTAFEMTVSPSDTIFAIKSKICRVEGIPVSQQQLVYNLRELEDASSLRALGIGDGARLRLVLRMRGGPVSSRRLPAPRDLDFEHLLDADRDDADWGGGSGCRVTMVVFREGERVNLLRVRHNADGSYSPLDHHNYSSSVCQSERAESGAGGASAGTQNAVTMGKMMELRRRMESLSIRRHAGNGDKAEIQKTRSEESLSMALRQCGDCASTTLARTTLPALLHVDDSDSDTDRVKMSDGVGSALVVGERVLEQLEQCGEVEVSELPPLPLPLPLPALPHLPELPALPAPDYGPLVGGEASGWRARAFGSSSQLAPALAPHSHATPAHARSASSLVRTGAHNYRKPQLAEALFSSSTSDLEALRRHRILPALARHRNTEHLHLSDDALNLPTRTESIDKDINNPKERKTRVRCGFCRKKLSIATVHKCRCGAEFCAPHRYAEVHGCAYDYKAHAHAYLQRANPLVSAPKLPKI